MKHDILGKLVNGYTLNLSLIFTVVIAAFRILVNRMREAIFDDANL